ncbi:class II aldolase/adducin family protein [Planctomycetota bacterium]
MCSEISSLLQTVTRLSQEFGTSEYVQGGGGNTSVKNADTLWVKPSGTTLMGLQPESFVAMNRAKLVRLYEVEIPTEPSAREALVKEVMAEAVDPGSSGRASVEAPLHDSLAARYVVHTHPVLVNGMTCGVAGKEACARLFPEALWLDYIDPGFTLCMDVRQRIKDFATERGREPEVIFLKNHGLFVAGEDLETVRAIYASILDRLKAIYLEAGVSMELAVADPPAEGRVQSVAKKIRQVMGDRQAAGIRASGMFPYPRGPITPDHIVYAKSYALIAEPTPDTIGGYQSQHGYLPQLIVCDDMVLGVGLSDMKAGLALELALDGALVQQLAAAFGGINYMTDRARKFIENWEVESYRSQQL